MAEPAEVAAEVAQIGPFVVLRKLGEGAMGVVYAGYDVQLDRKVAIKLVHRHLLNNPEVRVRMMREAQAMARLSSPNVVHVYQVGEHDDGIYLAMEYIDGQTLAAWLRAKPRPWPVVLRTVCDAGRGLAAAHHAGLIHRDFKPESGLASQVVENTSVPRLRRWYVPIVYQAGRPRQDRAARVRSERLARSRTCVTGIGAQRKESTQP